MVRARRASIPRFVLRYTFYAVEGDIQFQPGQAPNNKMLCEMILVDMRASELLPGLALSTDEQLSSEVCILTAENAPLIALNFLAKASDGPYESLGSYYDFWRPLWPQIAPDRQAEMVDGTLFLSVDPQLNRDALVMLEGEGVFVEAYVESANQNAKSLATELAAIAKDRIDS